MIDLHMHTSYSDGTDSVKEILSNANKAHLEVISITDHNSCLSYKEMDNFNINILYSGNIITGCEFTTSFKNRLIEVLGYGFDCDKVQKYLEVYYSKEHVNKMVDVLYNRLIKKISDLGLEFDLATIRKKKFNGEFFERGFYDELIMHPINKQLLKEDVWRSFSDFFRKGLTNPNSKLFINHAQFKPSLREIINQVHDAGGIIFLAHPYQYKFNDTEKFIDEIYDEYDLDGVECFYTTFSNRQSEYLLNFAKGKKLLISGGSDYHGNNKKQHELGVGRGNLNIHKDFINDWNVNYFK